MKDSMTAFMSQMSSFMDSVKGTKQAPAAKTPTAPTMPPPAHVPAHPQVPSTGRPRPILVLEPGITPALPIPSAFTIPRTLSVSNLSRRSDEDVESLSSEALSPEDLARSEVCQPWLAHVGEILVDVPDMEPTPEPSSLGTHVHSLRG